MTRVRRGTAEEELATLQFQVEHDSLTGIPNRRCFMRELAARARHPFPPGTWLVVGIIDLHGFKAINDLFGHETGDRILVHMAGILSECVGPGDLMARLGGDEFAFLLPVQERVSEVRERIERILSGLVRPVPLPKSGETLSLGGSVGATLFPDDPDPASLLHHADLALYDARKTRSSGWSLYCPEKPGRSPEGRIVRQIARALEDGSARFFFQPQVEFATGKICGAEALIRWDKGRRPWDEARTVIEKVERSRVARDLGRFALRQAGDLLERWVRTGVECPLSLSLGDRYAKSGSLAGDLERVFQDRPLASGRLGLLVRERTTHQDFQKIQGLFRELRRLGTRVAVADFGLGGLSLPSLLALGADRIVISPELVGGMLGDPVRLGLVANILMAGTTAGIDVLAAGVAHMAHFRVLREIGCPAGQGPFLTGPVSEDGLLTEIGRTERDGAGPSLSWPVHSPDGILLLFVREEPWAWMESHRWILESGKTAPGEEDLLLLGSRNRCGLGRWLAGPGKRRFGEEGGYSRIRSLHERFHDLADRLAPDALRSGRSGKIGDGNLRREIWRSMEEVAREIGQAAENLARNRGEG